MKSLWKVRKLGSKEITEHSSSRSQEPHQTRATPAWWTDKQEASADGSILSALNSGHVEFSIPGTEACSQAEHTKARITMRSRCGKALEQKITLINRPKVLMEKHRQHIRTDTGTWTNRWKCWEWIRSKHSKPETEPWQRMLSMGLWVNWVCSEKESETSKIWPVKLTSKGEGKGKTSSDTQRNKSLRNLLAVDLA